MNDINSKALLRKVDVLKEKLATLRPLNSAELKRLYEEFMILNTYDSNAIEGSTLTLRETALILKEDITIAQKPLKMHLEAIGHRDAFEYMLTIAQPEDPLTTRRIKELHSLVLMNEAMYKGVYRNVPVKILGSSNVLPQPYQVAPLMDELIVDYPEMKLKNHIIEAIAEFHLRFEGIHPFVDGNGRTGRLILNLELIKAGLLPVNIKFTDRQEYYQCFDAYFGEEKTAEPFVRMLANYEISELEKRIEILSY